MGIVPKKHVFGNRVSASTKAMIRDEHRMTMELVPTGYHRLNAAELAVHIFKAHFLSVLAGVADNFPMHIGCYHRQQLQSTY